MARGDKALMIGRVSVGNTLPAPVARIYLTGPEPCTEDGATEPHTPPEHSILAVKAVVKEAALASALLVDMVLLCRPARRTEGEAGGADARRTAAAATAAGVEWGRLGWGGGGSGGPRPWASGWYKACTAAGLEATGNGGRGAAGLEADGTGDWLVRVVLHSSPTAQHSSSPSEGHGDDDAGGGGARLWISPGSKMQLAEATWRRGDWYTSPLDDTVVLQVAWREVSPCPCFFQSLFHQGQSPLAASDSPDHSLSHLWRRATSHSLPSRKRGVLRIVTFGAERLAWAIHSWRAGASHSSHRVTRRGGGSHSLRETASRGKPLLACLWDQSCPPVPLCPSLVLTFLCARATYLVYHE